MEITATRLWHNGAWQIAAVVDGAYQAITYYGYNKREAMQRFRSEIKRRRFAK